LADDVARVISPQTDRGPRAAANPDVDASRRQRYNHRHRPTACAGVVATSRGDPVHDGTSMTSSRGSLVVGVPASIRMFNQNGFHAVAQRYIEAMMHWSGATAVIIPALGDAFDFGDMLDRLDGILLTGCPSNIEPHHYGVDVNLTPEKRDPQRDATTLPLVRRALADGVPLFAICRGFQEVNVALGGSLHQLLHEVPGRFDHRGGDGKPLEERFAPKHHVSLSARGQVADLLGSDRVIVNSLHGQGIDRLADDLVAEAVADDGTIEAVRVAGATTFALGVQWHPEWEYRANPVSGALFSAFGAAVRERGRLRSRSDR
jgi:putative glutamine amidotransferase